MNVKQKYAKNKKTKKTEIITKTPASNLFSDDTIKISKKTFKKTTKKNII